MRIIYERLILVEFLQIHENRITETTTDLS